VKPKSVFLIKNATCIRLNLSYKVFLPGMASKNIAAGTGR